MCCVLKNFGILRYQLMCKSENPKCAVCCVINWWHHWCVNRQTLITRHSAESGLSHRNLFLVFPLTAWLWKWTLHLSYFFLFWLQKQKVRTLCKFEAKKLLLPTGQCELDLDDITGRYPPLLVKDGKFVFPTDEERKLTFEEGDSLQLLCHGSHK